MKRWIPWIAIACLGGCDSRKDPKSTPAPVGTPQADSKPVEPGRDVGRPPRETPPAFVCPKDGCPYNSTTRERCLAHPDTELKAQWYSCPACGWRDGEPGRCSRCRRDLQRELRDE